MSKKKIAEEPQKDKIKAVYFQNFVVAENSDNARELYNQSRFGELNQENKIVLSLIEAIYLIDKGRIEVFDKRNKNIDAGTFLKKASRIDPNFWIRYVVFKDLRNRGYIVKTALKFGADFRVYDRGVKPGEDHAKWIVYPVHEGTALTWYDFAAKNRVAHSTKKRLLLGVVDEESDVSYWECRWIRP